MWQPRRSNYFLHTSNKNHKSFLCCFYRIWHIFLHSICLEKQSEYFFLAVLRSGQRVAVELSKNTEHLNHTSTYIKTLRICRVAKKLSATHLCLCYDIKHFPRYAHRFQEKVINVHAGLRENKYATLST